MSMHRATLVIVFLLSHSLVVGREPVKELASPGEMSSTFGGSPVCVAAALANLEVIEEERLVERSASLGMELGKALEVIAERHRADVRSLPGSGLFYSLHLKGPSTGAALPEQTDAIALALRPPRGHAFRYGKRLYQSRSAFDD